MKIFFILFIAVVFMITGCKNNKQAEYTILGDYTPYGGFIEKMNGKVEKVTEKIYWTVAEGDTFKKGDPVTIHERDSLKWYYDHESVFDSVGNLLLCNYIDENNKAIGTWQFFKENNMLVSAKWTWQDTIRENQKLKCDEKGRIVDVIAYSASADTILYTYTVNYNKSGDTVLYLGADSKGLPDLRVLNLYNEKGQFLSFEVYNKNDSLQNSNKVTFNEKGKISGITFYDKNKNASEVVNRNYPEYDAKGNWVKAITKDDKGHTLVSERTYTYFQ